MTSNNELYVKMALDAWYAQVIKANKMFASFSNEQLAKEVAPGRNTGIYLLGHLAAVNDKMLPLLNLGEQKHPHLNEPFLDKPNGTVAALPSTDDLRDNWTSSATELEKHFTAMQPQDWFERHTSVSE